LLPSLWKRGELQGPFPRTCIIVGISLRDISASNCRNRSGLRIADNRLHFVTRADFTLPDDGHVETSSPAGKKALYHVIHLKSHPELVAGKSRLRNDYLRRANQEPVANADRVLKRTGILAKIDGEIFSEHSLWQLAATQLLSPVLVVRDGIAVNRLM